MIMNALHAAGLGTTVAAGMMLAVPSVAQAQETVVVESSPPAALESSEVLPNRSLLRSGLFTLGASYVPALVVAIESENPADDHLYAPVVGPWFDLANRGDCEGDCDGETVNKVLLVTDGVFQGIGALQILGSFIFPESRAAATIVGSDGTPAVSFRVMPTKIARGSGLVAFGEF
jgi:hypothetical protein